MEKENLYMEDCIRTNSGIYINIFQPKLEDINIIDIAHALSHQCRFGGHLPKFYSVAQHSVFCSKMVNQEYKLEALLHDASEAYLLDIPSPIKRHLSNYHQIEDGLMKVISEVFGFQWPLSQPVKDVDRLALETEWYSIFISDSKEVEPIITPERSELAKAKFLSQFYQLTK